MLQLNDQSKIILFYKPVNFHKGIDALAQIVSTELGLELIPNLFILFSNRRKNRIKILFYDGKNLLLLSTRFENTLNFSHKDNVTLDQVAFNKFLDTRVSRKHLGRYKS